MSKRIFSALLFFILTLLIPACSDNKPQPFKDCPDCPEMVRLPGGKFWMGALSVDPEAADDEKPRHEVEIKSFAIAKYEATQAQWRAVTGDRPSKFVGCDTCPVEQVNFKDVQDFIQKLNAKTGKHYRLPTEAEWEYACRAGGSDRYCGGDDADALAWHSGNSGGKTWPVGQRLANGFGLHDMSGNVREWTQDCWQANYQGASGDGSVWLGVTGWDCEHRTRGGSWLSKPLQARSAYRGLGWARPVNDLGFRLAHD